MDLESRGIVRSCSENKGADQLRSYCEADLRLCFCLCRLLVFPCGGSNNTLSESFGKYVFLDLRLEFLYALSILYSLSSILYSISAFLQVQMINEERIDRYQRNLLYPYQQTQPHVRPQ